MIIWSKASCDIHACIYYDGKWKIIIESDIESDELLIISHFACYWEHSKP